MATSQNGWPVFTSPPPYSPKWITGRSLGGDVGAVLDYLCERFHAEVEPIRRDWSWGWAYRAIRGSSSGYSNHASGTARDLNAPSHPLGRRDTFTRKQRDAIHAILHDLQGVVRGGLDYSNRPDDMHFEINAGPAEVARVAALIRAGKLPRSTTATKEFTMDDAAKAEFAKINAKLDDLAKRVETTRKNTLNRDRLGLKKILSRK